MLTDYLNSLNYKFDVIAITETWLSDNDEEYYSMPGYKLLTANRVDKQGGGVCYYVNSELHTKIRTDLSINDNIESLFIEIEYGQRNRKKIAGVVYRPANNNYDDFEEKLSKILER